MSSFIKYRTVENIDNKTKNLFLNNQDYFNWLKTGQFYRKSVLNPDYCLNNISIIINVVAHPTSRWLGGRAVIHSSIHSFIHSSSSLSCV